MYSCTILVLILTIVFISTTVHGKPLVSDKLTDLYRIRETETTYHAYYIIKAINRPGYFTHGDIVCAEVNYSNQIFNKTSFNSGNFMRLSKFRIRADKLKGLLLKVTDNIKGNCKLHAYSLMFLI